MADTRNEEQIILTPIKRQTLLVQIEGLAPLIVHRFDEKAKRQILENQIKTKAKQKRPPQDPQAEYEASRYRLPDGRDGFPAVGFKSAIVGAARLFDGVTLVQLKQAVFVRGEGSEQLVPLDAEPRMREDVTRFQGSTGLRYRAEYFPWSVTLEVVHVPSVISPESVVALVNAGGLGGVGEWRPSAPKSLTGSYGTFTVVGGSEGVVL